VNDKERIELAVRLTGALSTLDEKDWSNLERLIGKAARNSESLEKGLDYFLALIDLIEEFLPLAEEFYREFIGILEGAEGIVEPREVVGEIKKYLDESDY